MTWKYCILDLKFQDTISEILLKNTICYVKIQECWDVFPLTLCVAWICPEQTAVYNEGCGQGYGDPTLPTKILHQPCLEIQGLHSVKPAEKEHELSLPLIFSQLVTNESYKVTFTVAVFSWIYKLELQPHLQTQSGVSVLPAGIYGSHSKQCWNCWCCKEYSQTQTVVLNSVFSAKLAVCRLCFVDKYWSESINCLSASMFHFTFWFLRS